MRTSENWMVDAQESEREPELETCPRCEGSGVIENEKRWEDEDDIRECPNCEGTGESYKED